MSSLTCEFFSTMVILWDCLDWNLLQCTDRNHLANPIKFSQKHNSKETRIIRCRSIGVVLEGWTSVPVSKHYDVAAQLSQSTVTLRLRLKHLSALTKNSICTKLYTQFQISVLNYQIRNLKNKCSITKYWDAPYYKYRTILFSVYRIKLYILRCATLHSNWIAQLGGI